MEQADGRASTSAGTTSSALGGLEMRPRDGLASASGRALTLSVREFGLLVAFVRARRGHRPPRGALPRGLGRAAARRRPLGRRLRPQAAREARGRAPGHALHPHPRRASATGSSRSLHTLFTPRSQLGNRLICEPMRASTADQLQGASLAVPRRSSPSAARRCSLLGIAACGSDDSSPATRRAARAARAPRSGGTINGAGATFPAPVYSEWAAASRTPRARPSTTRPSARAAVSRSSPPAPSTSARPTRR